MADRIGDKAALGTTWVAPSEKPKADRLPLTDASFQHAAISPGLNGYLPIFKFIPDLVALRWADTLAPNVIEPSYLEIVGWPESSMEQCLLSKHTDATHPRIPTDTMAIELFPQ
jgi:hypothetical protein